MPKYELFTTAKLYDYDALRSYRGPSDAVTLSKSGIHGVFTFDATDTASSDNAGTIIVANNGRRWKRVVGLQIDVEWFGVVGDDSTDNATALMAMRTWLVANNPKHYELIFKPGTYRYSNNKWLMGVKNYTVTGYGATFKCTANAAASRDNEPLLMAHPIEDYGQSTTYPGDATAFNSPGYLINTVSTGGRTVTTTTAAHAGNFAAGDLVLVHGFNQAPPGGSYPPSIRYFEWHTVVSANASTGVVTLTRGLENPYYSTWSDVQLLGSIYYGAARIMKCDNTWAYTRKARFKGLHFAANPNTSFNANTLNPKGLEIVFEDCDFTGINALGPTISKRVKFVRCTQDGLVEVDKWLDTVEYDDCEFSPPSAGADYKEISGAVGTNNLIFRRCRMENRAIYVSPRKLVFDDCDLINTRGVATSGTYGAIGEYDTIYPIHSVTLNRVRFKRSDTFTNNAVLFHSPSASTDKSLTATSTSGALILVDKATQLSTVHQTLAIGMWICKDDLSNYGTVTNIYDYDATYIAVQANLLANPATNDVFYWRTTNLLSVRDVSFEGPVHDILNASGSSGWSVVQKGTSFDATRYVARHSHKGVYFPATTTYTVPVNGRIARIRAVVSKAYTGTDATVVLRIYKRISGADTQIAVVNLKTAGERWVDANNAYGAVAGDTIATANLMCEARHLRFLVQGGSGGTNAVGGTTAQLPFFDIEVECIPYKGAVWAMGG